MEKNRHSFIKHLSMGIGQAVTGMPAFAAQGEKKSKLITASSSFNMCNYAAPKIPVARLAAVGLGLRGTAAVERMSYIEGVEIMDMQQKSVRLVKSHTAIL